MTTTEQAVPVSWMASGEQIARVSNWRARVTTPHGNGFWLFYYFRSSVENAAGYYRSLPGFTVGEIEPSHA